MVVSIAGGVPPASEKIPLKNQYCMADRPSDSGGFPPPSVAPKAVGVAYLAAP
jgi:hypothetical protein